MDKEGPVALRLVPKEILRPIRQENQVSASFKKGVLQFRREGSYAGSFSKGALKRARHGSPSFGEAEAGGYVSLRISWATQ